MKPHRGGGQLQPTGFLGLQQVCRTPFVKNLCQSLVELPRQFPILLEEPVLASTFLRQASKKIFSL